MRFFPVFFGLLATAVLMAPAHAGPYPQGGPCGSGLQPALHRIEITNGTAAATVYVDDENYALGNGLRIYEETNGVWVPKGPGIYQEGLDNANLQRGGQGLFPRDDDTCFDDVAAGPDTLIF